MNPFTLFGDLLHLLFGGIWSVLSALFGVLEGAVEAALVHLTTLFDRNPVGRWIGGFGLAVMVTTAGIRLLLSPVFTWQMRTQVRIAEDAAKMKPHLTKLRKEYGKDRAGMAAAQQALYKEHGQSPFGQLAGCLPMLVQFPMIWGLYYGIRAAVKQLAPAQRGFLWVQDVSRTGLSVCCTVGGKVDIGRILGAHWTVLLLPIMAGTLTVVQSKMMLPPPSPNPTEQDKMAQQTGKYVTYVIPVVILVTGVNFPQGLAIYWVTQSAFMITQQYHLLGWGQMPVPAWMPGARRQTALSTRKIAAATGQTVEKVRRISAVPGPPPTKPADLVSRRGEDQDSSENGRDNPSTPADVGPPRPTGRAKSRSSRPQNRKRRH